ncbi:glutaredoxin family protein [Patescibacteria group bacterium]
MNITVYTTTTCPYCEMLMDYLNEKGVKYIKKLVDEDVVAKKEMVEISDGFLGVPYTVVKRNGKIETIIGFNKNRLEDILGQ